MSEEKEAWVWLNMRVSVNPSSLRKAVCRFGSASGFLDAGARQSSAEEDSGRFTRLFRQAGRWREEARAEITRAAQAGVDIFIPTEPGYPEPLSHLENAPPILYVAGSYQPGDAAAIALVGSRRPSSYGRLVAGQFARALAELDIVTVSGMAEGIDTCVHEGTLAAGGRTLAVLGSGLGRFYPMENLPLSRRVREAGAVFSEFPMETPPYQANFPRRNRVIAGLALGTVVIEAADRSGALITARLAAEQGRDVFAVPGMINSPLSCGTHRLIQQGAKLVCSVRDILEEIEELKDRMKSLPLTDGGFGSPLPSAGRGNHGSGSPLGWPVEGVPEGQGEGEMLSDLEKRVLSKLTHEPVQMDFLAQALDRKPQELAVSMLALEMKGFVQAAPGNAYVRIPRYC
jgi:DNA processing protein